MYLIIIFCLSCIQLSFGMIPSTPEQESLFNPQDSQFLALANALQDWCVEKELETEDPVQEISFSPEVKKMSMLKQTVIKTAAKQQSQSRVTYTPQKLSKPLLTCPDCGITTSTLKRHYRAVHLKEKKFKCLYSGCLYRSAQRSNLNRHIEKMHEKNS